jgi:putative resolvase
MNDRAFITIGEASKISGINIQTIRKMVDRGEIPCYKTVSGHRKINREGLLEYIESGYNIGGDTNGRTSVPIAPRTDYIYARVSSKKQEDDLERQIQFIKDRCGGTNGVGNIKSQHVVISDIGSGINFKKKGLKTLLDASLQGTIGEVVIAHRDRLCRFGFELIEYIILKGGGTIRVVGDSESKTLQQELSEDLLSIIHIFNCRQMGSRKYGKKGKEGPTESSEDTASTD